jgi:periplasmic protein TonB
MSAAAISFRAPVLAWAIAIEDEARFKRILQRIVGVAALACVVFSLMPRPQDDRAKPPELPQRLAKLVLEREPLPLPTPNKAPEPQSLAKAHQPLPAKADPRPAPKPERTKEAPVPEARRPQPNKPPGEIEGARRQAAGVGLLAMKDQLAELRGAPVAVQLKQDIKPGPGVGTGVGVGVGAGNEPGLPARALITSNLTGGSGGINTAAYSRNTGGGGLAGRATTSAVRAVAAPAATATASAAASERAAAARPRARSKKSSSSSSATRARSTPCTTVRCAKSRACRARWSSS